MLNRTGLKILEGELVLPQYSDLMKTQEYAAIAAMLNEAPAVPNPEPQADVPKRFEIGDVFEALKPEDLAAVRAIPDWVALVGRIESALAANDRASLQRWLALIQGDLSAGGVATLAGLMAVTEPDPGWQATVPGVSRAAELGLPRVTEHDVQAVEQGLI